MTLKFWKPYLFFLLLMILDGALSIRGIMLGYFEELNPIICGFSSLFHISVVQSIITIKGFGLIIWAMIAFRLPVLIQNEDQAKKVALKLLIRPDFPKKFIWAANVLILVFGVAPGIVFTALNKIH